MNKDTQITYAIVGVTILLLGGIAFFLRPVPKKLPQDERTTTTQKQAVQVTSTQSQAQATTTENKPMDQQTFQTATITTNKGTIEVAFGNVTPKTVKNFGTLANSHYYDGVRFHRVIKGFMIQAGDPLSKDKANIARWGTGGPGYTFEDELTGKEQYPQGTLAMANAGPNTNGSQFFIVTAQPGAPLPPSYTVFGHVTKGMDVALAIENVKTGQADRPLDNVIIEKVEAK
jgi:cyclophilin family peptidyl-prolyl cis-trans isomerase